MRCDMYDYPEFSELVGKTLTNIEQLTDGVDVTTLVLSCADGSVYQLYHAQDCCERVRLEDVIGDLDDLIDTPILMAEVVTNSDDPPMDSDDSYTWTFYKLATVRGYVTLRWYGGSNGYYSEDVTFDRVN